MVQNNEITNRQVNQYFENLCLIGTFGVYENKKCTGFSVYLDETESIEPRNGIFISTSENGNASIMVMRANDDEEIIGIDETEKLKVGFKASGLTLNEAETQARELRVKNEDFLSMMAGGQGTGVTVKAPEAEFNIEE